MMYVLIYLFGVIQCMDITTRDATSDNDTRTGMILSLAWPITGFIVVICMIESFIKGEYDGWR